MPETLKDVTSAPTTAAERVVADIKKTVETVTFASSTAVNPFSTVVVRAEETTRDLVAMNEAGAKAAFEASRIFVEGALDLWRQGAEAAQVAFATAISGYKDLAAVKSPAEYVELQARLTRDAVNATVSETTRLATAGLKVTEAAAAPITGQVVQAAEKFSARAKVFTA